jgi:hypothetical protein
LVLGWTYLSIDQYDIGIQAAVWLNVHGLEYSIRSSNPQGAENYFSVNQYSGLMNVIKPLTDNPNIFQYQVQLLPLYKNFVIS